MYIDICALLLKFAYLSNSVYTSKYIRVSAHVYMSVPQRVMYFEEWEPPSEINSKENAK